MLVALMAVPGGLVSALVPTSAALLLETAPLASPLGPWTVAVAGAGAEAGLTIYANGSLSDPTAPIAIEGRTYTLTGPLNLSLRDERNGSVVDGNNFSISPGAASPFGVQVLQASDVILRSLVVEGAVAGLQLLGAVNATIEFFGVVNASTGVEIAGSGPVLVENVSTTGATVGLSITSAQGVRVAGSRLSGATWAVNATQVAGLRIEDSDLHGSGTGAVRFLAGTGLTLTDCDLSATAEGTAIGLNASGAIGVTVTGSRADDTRVGFAINGSGQILLRGNSATRSGTAVDLESDEFVTVTGNDFRSAAGVTASAVAIRADQLMEFTITQNNVTGADGTAIAVSYGTHGTVTGNNVSEAGYVGFAISASHNLQLTDNVADHISAAGAYGFLFRENGRLDFLRNHAVGDYNALSDTLSNRLWVVDSNLSYPIATGIVTHNDRELQIRSSEIFGAPAGAAAIDIEQGVTTLLSGNSVNGSAGTGIRAVDDLDLSIVGNLAVGTAGPAIEVQGGSSVQVTSNLAGGTPGAAIHLERVTNLSVSANRVFASGVGIEVIGGVTAVLADNNATGNEVGFLAWNATASVWTSNDLFENALSFRVRPGLGSAIYHNNFVAEGGYAVEAANGSGRAAWDGGYPFGGNYWGNWTGPDVFGGAGQNVSGPDGIVDSGVGPAGSPIDRYPLAAPWTVTAVTFVEQGLPPGVGWGVDFNGTRFVTTAASLAVPEVNGAYTPYAFSAVTPAGYRSLNGTGHGQLHRQSLTTYLWFTPSASTYGVTFTETGLPADTSWSVQLGATTLTGEAPSLTASLPNGSYTFDVPGVAGYWPAPSAGTVGVIGANISVPIAFSPVVYAVAFQASGLPASAGWVVAVGAARAVSVSSTVVFSLANGTYAFSVSGPAGYIPVPDRGVLVVSGSPISVHVAFVGEVYPLSFLGVGLPAGVAWAVVVGGGAHTVAGAAWSIALANGSYEYTVRPPPDYLAEPASGSVTIDGGPVAVEVSFHRPTYLVTFRASGTPPAGAWRVSVGDQVVAGWEGAASLGLPNGSYPFVIAATGYVADPAEGTVTVSGAGVEVPVVFGPSAGGSTSPGPLSTGLVGIAMAALAGVAAGAAGVLIYRSVRRRRPPAGTMR